MAKSAKGTRRMNRGIPLQGREVSTSLVMRSVARPPDASMIRTPGISGEGGGIVPLPGVVGTVRLGCGVCSVSGTIIVGIPGMAAVVGEVVGTVVVAAVVGEVVGTVVVAVVVGGVVGTGISTAVGSIVVCPSFTCASVLNSWYPARNMRMECIPGVIRENVTGPPGSVVP
ncbi:MAG: hypothetical protein A4E39_01219 [Methanoregulaceae archaeon PtaB.Bin152]|nr:MAG: hypothetical protein A4E39_01219 [Methanoregulaceae archaeon PtaB.Bin152]